MEYALLVATGSIRPNQIRAFGKPNPCRNLGFLFKKKKKKTERKEREAAALKESNLHVTKITQAAVSRMGDRNGEGLEAEETAGRLQYSSRFPMQKPRKNVRNGSDYTFSKHMVARYTISQC